MRYHISFRSLKTSTVTVALAVMLIGLSILAVVSALPPPSNLPIPLSGYGVVAVYTSAAAQATLGTINIKVDSSGDGAFFVIKLLVFLNIAQQSDLLLSTITVDTFYTMSLSQYYGPQTPKVVVVPSGFTMGEVVSALPSYLSAMLVKEPFGNMAIVCTNGFAVGLTFATPGSEGTIGAEAIVTAQTNDTITIALS